MLVNIFSDDCKSETAQRVSVIYFPETGKIYCYVCKLFRVSANKFSNQFKAGFDDWKHASSRIVYHETSNVDLLA
jgi:hypothetical protein